MTSLILSLLIAIVISVVICLVGFGMKSNINCSVEEPIKYPNEIYYPFIFPRGFFKTDEEYEKERKKSLSDYAERIRKKRGNIPKRIRTI